MLVHFVHGKENIFGIVGLPKVMPWLNESLLITSIQKSSMVPSRRSFFLRQVSCWRRYIIFWFSTFRHASHINEAGWPQHTQQTRPRKKEFTCFAITWGWRQTMHHPRQSGTNWKPVQHVSLEQQYVHDHKTRNHKKAIATQTVLHLDVVG